MTSEIWNLESEFRSSLQDDAKIHYIGKGRDRYEKIVELSEKIATVIVQAVTCELSTNLFPASTPGRHVWGLRGKIRSLFPFAGMLGKEAPESFGSRTQRTIWKMQHVDHVAEIQIGYPHGTKVPDHDFQGHRPG